METFCFAIYFATIPISLSRFYFAIQSVRCEKGKQMNLFFIKESAYSRIRNSDKVFIHFVWRKILSFISVCQNVPKNMLSFTSHQSLAHRFDQCRFKVLRIFGAEPVDEVLFPTFSNWWLKNIIKFGQEPSKCGDFESTPLFYSR